MGLLKILNVCNTAYLQAHPYVLIEAWGHSIVTNQNEKFFY